MEKLVVKLKDFILKLNREEEVIFPEFEKFKAKDHFFLKTYAIFSLIFESLGEDFTEDDVSRELERRELMDWLQEYEYLGDEVLGIVYIQYKVWRESNFKSV